MNTELTTARKSYSRIGWAFSAVLAIAIGVQFLWGTLSGMLGLEESAAAMWLGTFLPVHGIAIPAGLLLLKALPAQAPQDQKLGAKRFWTFFPICFFVMYTGNFIGTGLSLLLSGGTAENAVMEYAMDNSPLKILFMVILAPLLEELICRKYVIDRTRRYGEKTAVVLSAVIFGLLHQNFFQFFYAFGLGLIFAYIYIRTGRLRYSVIFHIIINFMGSVLAPGLLSMVDMDALAALETGAAVEEMVAIYGEILPGLLMLLGYVLLLLIMSVVGLVLLIIRWKKAVWREAEQQLPRGSVAKTVYFNWGMGIYILLCVAGCVYALI